MEYLEELFPEPSLIGRTALARARTRRAERIASEIFAHLSTYVLHAHPFFRTRPGRPVAQVEAVAHNAQLALLPLFEVAERDLTAHPYFCGDAPSVADCTLFAGAWLAKRFEFPIPPSFPGLVKWFERFSSRDSARQIVAPN